MPDKITRHDLVMTGDALSLNACNWSCACGQWGPMLTPRLGPYGRTTAKARIAQIKMAHGKHVKGAILNRTPQDKQP